MEHSIQSSPLPKHCWPVRFSTLFPLALSLLSYCQLLSLTVFTHSRSFVFIRLPVAPVARSWHITKERGMKALQKHFYVKMQQLKLPVILTHSTKQNLIFLQPGGASVLFEREKFFPSSNRTCLERRQLNLKPCCWASAVQWRSWTESLASPGWPCTAEPPPPDLDPPQLPVLCCPSEEGEREARVFTGYYTDTVLRFSNKLLSSYLFFTVQKCVIFVVMERVIETVCSTSLCWQLQVLASRERWGYKWRKSSQISRQMYYWNSMTIQWLLDT